MKIFLQFIILMFVFTSCNKKSNNITEDTGR
jgi:hypothetical protein